MAVEVVYRSSRTNNKWGTCFVYKNRVNFVDDCIV